MEQDPANLVRLKKFKEMLAARHTIARFSDASDLGRRVEGDLKHLIEKTTKARPRPTDDAGEARARIFRDLEVAAQVQQNLLPKAAPKFKNLDLAGRCVASQSVGGDYYEFLEFSDSRVGVVIADVAGKGIGAALLSTALQARILILAEEMQSLGQFMTRLNASTCKKIAEDRFITLFFGLIDTDRHELVYCSAGHTPPLLARADDTVERLAAGGIVLGLIPDVVYEQTVVKVSPGDVLLLYTDGVTECLSVNDEEFGEERLALALREHRQESAAGIVDAVMRAVNDWRHNLEQSDDITMVAAKITG
jgi:sigma-B regulation protein RsbU (phosphoserine phosphatase)